MVCEPASSCRGLEEAVGEAGRAGAAVSSGFLSLRPIPLAFTLSVWLFMAVSLLPSFFQPSFLSWFVFPSVRVSFCQLSAPSVWFLHDKDLIFPLWFLNLQLPLLGKGKRKFIRPGRWYDGYVRATLKCHSYVRNMQLTKRRCFTLWITSRERKWKERGGMFVTVTFEQEEENI